MTKTDLMEHWDSISCDPSITLSIEKLQTDLSPLLSAHSDSINLNGKLYARVKTLYDNRDKLGLNAEQMTQPSTIRMPISAVRS